jgi:hypothetical protein
MLSAITLGLGMFKCRYVECRYAECHYAECRLAQCRGTFLQAVTLRATLHSTIKKIGCGF